MSDLERAALLELLRRVKIWWNAEHGSDDERVTLGLVVEQLSALQEESDA